MSVTVRLGTRLRAARKAAGFKTSKEFLIKYKVPASTYSQHESGARQPDDNGLQFYSDVFNVNFNWLKTGKGQAYKKIIPSQKNSMSEELFSLKKPEINQQILIKSLEDALNHYAPELKISSATKIAKKTIEIYKNTTFKSR